MFISKLCLRNYRNFKGACIRFTKGVNTIIGENGCGKTNIMQAMRILLDETLPRTYRFYESDFNRSIGNWRGHWIVIQLFFDELDHGDECQVLALQLIGSANEIDQTKGSCTAVFRPKIEFRNRLYQYSQLPSKSAADFEALRNTITLEDYELCYMARTTVELSEEDNYHHYVGDFETIEFPDPEDSRFDVFGNRLHITQFLREVSCTFIKALRDVETDLRSYRDNPLVNLLRGKERSIEVSKKNEIVRKITDLNEEISTLPEVKEVASGITQNINTSVGETYAPTVSIRSELPDDMERLMQSLKLWVGDCSDDGYLGRIWELSLGGCNLIYLSTKLLEYEKVKSRDKVANFLLIEEPEAHIHTHIQKTLFDKVPEDKTQVIFTTHSTHISAVSKISSVNIISKFAHRVEVYEPSRNLAPKSLSRIERYLDAVRSDLLFAKSVMLVEGDAEQILIPVLFKKVFGLSLDEIGISLINIGSTGFVNLARLFHPDRIHKQCAILTDLDTSIVELTTKPEDDNKFQTGCRQSELSGKQRKEKLEAFTATTPYVRAFYAEYTFEVDFLLAGNSFEVVSLTKDLYKTKAAQKKVKQALEDDSTAVSGKEILRLANGRGKGWFALLLSEKVTARTYLPDYILKALSFCMANVPFAALKSIAVRRLQILGKVYKDAPEINYKEVEFNVTQITSKEQLIKYLAEALPEDNLTTCYQYIHGTTAQPA